MKQWYAKELSQLTRVSVRTLHHYDKIGLLKPSMRLANSYRLYSEKDLLRLQQIIALKFFGFELAQIQFLLTKQDDVLENFAMQAKLLHEKAQALQEAGAMLQNITDDCCPNKSIPWEKIIQLIEVYHMTQQIDHAWVKEIFTPEELKQYAEFETEMKRSHKKAAFEKQWQNLLAALKANLHHEPTSKTAIEVAKEYMDWVNSLYGKKYAHLRTKKWEQGFGEGKGLEELGLTPEIMLWLEKAVGAYWTSRIAELLDQIGTIPPTKALKQWHQILDELYGNEEARKTRVYEMALQDDKVSPAAKAWLKSLKDL